jgi:hypothetical protein
MFAANGKNNDPKMHHVCWIFNVLIHVLNMFSHNQLAKDGNLSWKNTTVQCYLTSKIPTGWFSYVGWRVLMILVFIWSFFLDFWSLKWLLQVEP